MVWKILVPLGRNIFCQERGYNIFCKMSKKKKKLSSMYCNDDIFIGDIANLTYYKIIIYVVVCTMKYVKNMYISLLSSKLSCAF